MKDNNSIWRDNRWLHQKQVIPNLYKRFIVSLKHMKTEEFNIKKLVIEHGTEAHEVKEFLKEKNIPVAFGPMLTPRIKMELRKRNYSSVLHLIEAGVKVALITDHPYNSIDQLRSIATLAISEGLKTIDALKAITINPAQIHILNTKVVITIINGKIVFDRSKLI